MVKLKVLVIDDEKHMCSAISKALAQYNPEVKDTDEKISFSIDTAYTAKEAFRKIEKMDPDIILLDYKLPDMSGLDILQKVKFDESECLVIMITAYASLETAVSAIKSGAFDFIAKPFSPEDLRKTVFKAVQQLILARQVRKLTEEKRKVRFQFISVLGHELKAPLNAIEGYLSLIKEKALGDDVSNYMEMIERCLIRIDGMRKLIVDLLDLTRIESGEKKRELGNFNIVDIAEESVENIKMEAEKRGIEIILQAEKEIYANCDRGEILVIFNNLISNAVKYNKDNGKVWVRIKRDDGKVNIEVEDTGIGMTKEDQKKLFKEFTRIRNEKTKHILGSGLGLAIVKKIADLYNGSVSVESEPDKGSKFKVILVDKTNDK
ncbi:MAG: hypothetical protein DRP91_07010 [Candidatus Neomarinimicrobiota bacterium]|nr:MAG: hypothetical protein DRP91_07010 [Candidatus Neomarinimicrobiota bacterium]